MTARRPVASIPQVMGLQGALDEKRGLAVSPGATASLMSLLDKGYSTAIQVLGDSTGNGTDEWVYLLAQKFAADYPAYTVRHRLWNDATQSYDAPTVIQAGAGGERSVNLDGAVALINPASTVDDITGDIDVRFCGQYSSTPQDAALLSKFGVGSSVRSWRLEMTTGKFLFFGWNPNGSSEISRYSTVALPTAANTTFWVRVTLVVATGQVTFYTSSDGATWTQLGGLPAAAGATALYPATGQSIWAGTRGGPGLVGKVIELDVRSGINGFGVVSRMPESWYQNYSGVVGVSGAPVLDIINGSMSGAGILTYLDLSAARRNAMMLRFGQSLILTSTSHNDVWQGVIDSIAAYATWLANIRARLPLVPVVVMSQNPRMSPAGAALVFNHARQCARLAGFAATNGVGFIDIYKAFAESPLPLSALVSQTDGVHPQQAGSDLWAETAYKTFQQRA